LLAALVLELLLSAGPVSAADPSNNAHAMSPGELGSLEAAFRSCVDLKDHHLAGPLFDSVRDAEERGFFAAHHPQSVARVTIERGAAYSTLTAHLKQGARVAGVPVLAIYAATCPKDCGLALWGLDLGRTTPAQRADLNRWVQGAPATPTDYRGNVKVQLNQTTDDRTVLVCDLSG
jgi:hypothetical protein